VEIVGLSQMPGGYRYLFHRYKAKFHYRLLTIRIWSVPHTELSAVR
jgi:hypothetical protein